MLGIGGVIGAGLFVGTGAVVGSTGPAAVVSYLLGGLLVILVIRMLGEMAAARPSVGSFSQYARDSLGDWAGFTVAWLYWYFWVFVIAWEAVAAARILQEWVPSAPLWLFSLVLMTVMTANNLISVRSFGEVEFWLASVKVVTLVSFLLLGASFVFGLWPDSHLTFANLYTHGGFAPNGWGAVLTGMVLVIFFYFGAELVTLAAAESEEPGREVARATVTVTWRIFVFYVGSVLVIVTMLPWNRVPTDGSSPFAVAIERLGIPAAATVINFVVLSAVLSVLNSGIYAASRMLFALSDKGDAPQALRLVNTRGVPVFAILASTAVGFLSVGAAFLWPDTVFLFLANSTGAVGLFIYLFIALSQLRMRRRLEREAPELLRVKMWFYPYLTYAAIVGLLVVLASMAFMADVRSQLLLSLLSLVVFLAAAAVRARFRQAGPVVTREEVGTEERQLG